MSSSIYSGGYGSKIRKVKRYRPVVSNETIVATRLGFFLTKVAPIQSITNNVLLVFLINAALLNVCFILYYHLFFFECLYFSECDIRMSLYVYWLKKWPSIKYADNRWEDRGSSKMLKAAQPFKQGCHTLCVLTHSNLTYIHLHFFSCFWQHFVL